MRIYTIFTRGLGFHIRHTLLRGSYVPGYGQRMAALPLDWVHTLFVAGHETTLFGPRTLLVCLAGVDLVLIVTLRSHDEPNDGTLADLGCCKGEGKARGRIAINFFTLPGNLY